MIGMIQTIANAGNPDIANSYIASKNRRKSKITLPPLLREYVINSFGIIWHGYFQWQSAPFETRDRQSY